MNKKWLDKIFSVLLVAALIVNWITEDPTLAAKVFTWPILSILVPYFTWRITRKFTYVQNLMDSLFDNI